MKRERTLFLRFIVPVTYILMVAVNVLANTLPINGRGTGDISDAYGNFFAPAGITFAIWGIIYILLALFSFYFVTNINKVEVKLNLILKKIGVYFAISSVANTIWIFAWHYDVIGVSLVLMLIILLCLIRINLTMREFKYSKGQRFLIRLPFNVYFGWITVATIANVTTFLVAIKWNRFSFSEVFWTMVIISVGAIIGFISMLFYKSWAYGLVLIWAYAGILLKHLSETDFNRMYPSIIITVIVSLVLLFLGELLLIRQTTVEKRLHR